MLTRILAIIVAVAALSSTTVGNQDILEASICLEGRAVARAVKSDVETAWITNDSFEASLGTDGRWAMHVERLLEVIDDGQATSQCPDVLRAAQNNLGVLYYLIGPHAFGAAMSYFASAKSSHPLSEIALKNFAWVTHATTVPQARIDRAYASVLDAAW